MRDKKLSVIVPAYKEGKNIRRNLEYLKEKISRLIPNYEIIVVIDGKVDNAFEEASKVEGVKVHGYTKNSGKGFALRYGYKFVTGDVVTFIDADGDINPAQLLKFYSYLSSADLVIGSKRHPFSKIDNYPLSRKILSKGYSMFIRILFGLKLSDTQTGLKLIKREVLDVIMPSILIKKYAFDLELCFLAYKQRFRIVEAPIFISYQNNGSGINKQAVYRIFVDTLAIWYRYYILHYYQKQYHKYLFKK